MQFITKNNFKKNLTSRVFNWPSKFGRLHTILVPLYAILMSLLVAPGLDFEIAYQVKFFLVMFISHESHTAYTTYMQTSYTYNQTICKSKNGKRKMQLSFVLSMNDYSQGTDTCINCDISVFIPKNAF